MRQSGTRLIALAAIGAAVLTSAGVVVAAVTPWPAGSPAVGNRVALLEPGAVWEQQIELEQNDLDRIELGLERSGPGSGTLRLELRSGGAAGPPVAGTELPFNQVDNVRQLYRRPDPFASFRFAPGSATGGTIWLRLESAADQPVRVRYLQRGDGTKAIMLRTYYRATPAERVVALARRVTDGRPGLLGAGPTYLAALALYGALLGAAAGRLLTFDQWNVREEERIADDRSI